MSGIRRQARLRGPFPNTLTMFGLSLLHQIASGSSQLLKIKLSEFVILISNQGTFTYYLATVYSSPFVYCELYHLLVSNTHIPLHGTNICAVIDKTITLALPQPQSFLAS